MKIPFSSSQLIAILILCRLYTILTFTAHDNSLLVCIVGTIMSVLLQLLLLIPIFLIARYIKPTDFWCTLKKNSRPFYYLSVFLLSFFFLFMATYTLSTFKDFLVITLFPREGDNALLLLMMVSVFFSIYYGLPSLLRMSSLVSFFIAVITVIMILFSLFDGSPYNIKPVLDSPLQRIGIQALYTSIRNFELIPLFYLAPRVKKSLSSILKHYLLLTTLIICMLLFVIMFVLGDYVQFQSYPLYALTSFVHISLIQRLDAFYAIIWITIAFIKISFYSLLCLDVLQNHLPKRISLHKLSLALFVIIYVTVLIKEQHYNHFINGVYYLSLSGVFLAVLVVLPIILLLYHVISWRKSHD